jgi:phenylacetic acid degradation protein/carnitine operon protein CaiE
MLPSEMKEHSQEVEPLLEIPKNRPSQESLFEVWEKVKKINNLTK